MENMPALPPPDGVTSNFVDPPTLLQPVIITSAFVLAITTIFVALRLFTRFFVVREVHVEDYCCILAWIGLVSYTAVILYSESIGLARHQWDVTVPMFYNFLYWINIITIIYGPAALFAKLTVFFQIKRIFVTARRNTVYWVVQVSIALNIIFYTGMFFTYVFDCWPREAIWNPNVQGKCSDQNKSNLVAGILNVVSDVEALLVPAWAIWHLKMPMQKKISVSAVFGIGLFAVAVGIVGLYFRVNLLTDKDFTWGLTQLGMLVISEIGIVIIVGCVPSLPMFTRFCANGFSRQQKSSGWTYRVTPRSFLGRKKVLRTEDNLSAFGPLQSRDFERCESVDQIELLKSPSDKLAAQHSQCPGGGITKTTELHQRVEAESEAERLARVHQQYPGGGIRKTTQLHQQVEFESEDDRLARIHSQCPGGGISKAIQLHQHVDMV